MMIVGLILGALGIEFFCWLLFTLAVYALPFSASLTAGLAACHSGAGLIGSIVVGILAGAVTLCAGQFAFAAVGSLLIRAAIALLFAHAGGGRRVSCDACRRARWRVVTRMARGVRNHWRDPRRRHGRGAGHAPGGPAREQ
jgi:hypothetical protein